MVVVDTNVIAALYLNPKLTPYAEALLERDSDWAAPPLWRSEMRNALATGMRHQRFPLAEARRIQREAESQMASGEFEVDSLRVLELAQASGCTAYDCEFVALAEQLDVRLVTADAQLLAAFPHRTLALAEAG